MLKPHWQQVLCKFYHGSRRSMLYKSEPGYCPSRRTRHAPESDNLPPPCLYQGVRIPQLESGCDEYIAGKDERPSETLRTRRCLHQVEGLGAGAGDRFLMLGKGFVRLIVSRPMYMDSGVEEFSNALKQYLPHVPA